jgi:acyl-CoA dehydrogenase
MDLSLAPQDLAFRDEVRQFLEANVPPALRRANELTTGFLSEPELAIGFHRALYRKGWSVYFWPKEHGGTGWSAVQRYIFETECGRFGAPTYNSAGAQFVGPVIIRFGTAEQKQTHLPRIARGDDYWAQGYSEPGSGSDLASLKTRARASGDDYIVDGQKIWTSHAHNATRIFALVRTSNEGKPQEGISFLLIDMESPGITVRPIIGNGGDHEFNEVFFDGVRVPKANRIGEENKGWNVAKYLLEFERGGRFVAGRARAEFARLVRQARLRCPGDPDIEARTAEIGLDLDALEMLELSVLSAIETGQNPGAISSLVKLRWSEIRQAIAETAVEITGEDALRWIAERPFYETLQLPPDEEDVVTAIPRYLNSRAYTIMGGTSEVQMNILARALLGL